MTMQYVGAYLVRGGEEALDALVTRLEKEKVTARGSVDLFERTYRAFGVGDAEELRNRARTKPPVGAHRVFALFVPSITTEAQNALLKTLEEPAANALFFLVTPSPETLLPTIRSRVQMLDVAANEVGGIIDADVFLAASPEKRLMMLKPLYDHEDEGRDVGSIVAFLFTLERRFAAGNVQKSREGIHAIYRARKYASDKGSLLKSLLEQVALLAPKM
jgi:hypothetical protein